MVFLALSFLFEEQIHGLSSGKVFEMGTINYVCRSIFEIVSDYARIISNFGLDYLPLEFLLFNLPTRVALFDRHPQEKNSEMLSRLPDDYFSSPATSSKLSAESIKEYHYR